MSESNYQKEFELKLENDAIYYAEKYRSVGSKLDIDDFKEGARWAYKLLETKLQEAQAKNKDLEGQHDVKDFYEDK